mmetsp:Transcript_30113/g.70229  ORF Transcript_30113/g.70229 Transcript_30113/m.70229 type:complete len:252 (-) Transcript_30113:30-785(-)
MPSLQPSSPQSWPTLHTPKRLRPPWPNCFALHQPHPAIDRISQCSLPVHRLSAAVAESPLARRQTERTPCCDAEVVSCPFPPRCASSALAPASLRATAVDAPPGAPPAPATAAASERLVDGAVLFSPLALAASASRDWQSSAGCQCQAQLTRGVALPFPAGAVAKEPHARRAQSMVVADQSYPLHTSPLILGSGYHDRGPLRRVCTPGLPAHVNLRPSFASWNSPLLPADGETDLRNCHKTGGNTHTHLAN